MLLEHDITIEGSLYRTKEAAYIELNRTKVSIDELFVNLVSFYVFKHSEDRVADCMGRKLVFYIFM